MVDKDSTKSERTERAKPQAAGAQSGERATQRRKFIRWPADQPHPAFLEEADLLKQCEVTFGRTGGPGGQHRNKVETAATITHVPTGIAGSAGERRSQSQNRHEAIKRLRLSLAVKVRRTVHRDHYKPTELWTTRRQGEKMPVAVGHSDVPALLAEALDVIIARGYDVAGAAGVLGITMSQLAKLLAHEKRARALVNEGRESRGLRALK